MDRREIDRFLAAIRRAQAAVERAAVATIVRVRGSAYRREGTYMLIRPDGTYECALSGGCLEPSVAEAAVRVIETGEPVVVNYDLADDSLWGLGMGCSGAIDVRIERLDELEEREAQIFSERFLLKRPLLEAITEERSPVLLIDEVDRADEAFEAFLLEVLAEWQVTIPELGTIRAKHKPHVIITSNRTRELSDALRRRCLFLWLPHPNLERPRKERTRSKDGASPARQRRKRRKSLPREPGRGCPSS